MNKKFFNPNFGKNLKIKKGFTLAEVLVTLAILGVVAAITIPSITRNNLEKRNRVKIRKALASYESLVEKASIEYGLKSNAALNNWANNDNQCTNGKQQFKISEVDADFPCVFKTTDGLWWNIKNLDQTIVAFKQNDVTLYNAISRFSGYKAFMFVTEFDQNGSIRVNDKGYAPNATSSYYEYSVDKVQRYLDGEREFDNLNAKLLDKYSTPCNAEKTNVPCSEISNDGKQVKVYLDANGPSGGPQGSPYTTVTFYGCTDGKNCSNTIQPSEYIDNKDGTYTSFVTGRTGSHIVTYKYDQGRGWYQRIVQKCTDNTFSSCSSCTKYDSLTDYYNSRGQECSSSEMVSYK